jgi:hypothetical protein
MKTLDIYPPAVVTVEPAGKANVQRAAAQSAEPVPYEEAASTAPEAKNESRWSPYIKALAFVVPAIVAWGIACAAVIPGFQEYYTVTNFEPGGWFSGAPVFLLQFGPSICVALLLLLIAPEMLVRGWARYRKVAVSLFVGLINFGVVFGLMTLHTWMVLVIPGL